MYGWCVVSCLQVCDIPVVILESGKLGRTLYLCQILLLTGGKMTHRNFQNFQITFWRTANG